MELEHALVVGVVNEETTEPEVARVGLPSVLLARNASRARRRLVAEAEAREPEAEGQPTKMRRMGGRKNSDHYFSSGSVAGAKEEGSRLPGPPLPVVAAEMAVSSPSWALCVPELHARRLVTTAAKVAPAFLRMHTSASAGRKAGAIPTDVVPSTADYGEQQASKLARAIRASRRRPRGRPPSFSRCSSSKPAASSSSSEEPLSAKEQAAHRAAPQGARPKMIEEVMQRTMPK